MTFIELIKNTEKMSKDEFVSYIKALQDIAAKHNIIFQTAQSEEKNEPSTGRPSPLKLGLLEGKIHVPDDFNEPLDDLNQYMYE